MVGVYGRPEAAKIAYLGLYALQHRGQESAGIVSNPGAHRPQAVHRGMGLVADVFNERILEGSRAATRSATCVIRPRVAARS